MNEYTITQCREAVKEYQEKIASIDTIHYLTRYGWLHLYRHNLERWQARLMDLLSEREARMQYTELLQVKAWHRKQKMWGLHAAVLTPVEQRRWRFGCIAMHEVKRQWDEYKQARQQVLADLDTLRECAAQDNEFVNERHEVFGYYQ